MGLISSHHADAYFEGGEPGGADWSHLHPRTEWFHVRELDPGVHVISEPGHVNSYLIQGTELAVLVDTGLGVANIRSVAESLTGQPLQVINSHYHFDHSGGNRLFGDIAIHEAGKALLERPAPDGLAPGYMKYVERLLDAWQDYKDADDVFFHLLSAERMVRPLPEDFNPDDYKIVPTVATRTLVDNEVIDLGGRQLRVLHTPGHSPDSICLLDESNGLLFGGDTINTGPIYAQLEDSDLEDFASSTARLAELADSVRRVFVCHFMRLDNPASLLREVAEGFDAIVHGDVEYRDNVDCLDFPVKEACFDNFSVFVNGGSGSLRV
ncbi:MAG: MBL fold metallo-hydrolase [Acidobacteria bacterium]|nr:MBL fold metallo-hydrolase [Acidobacteriota bacterium]